MAIVINKHVFKGLSILDGKPAALSTEPCVVCGAWVDEAEDVYCRNTIRHINDGICPICDEDASMGGTHQKDCPFSGGEVICSPGIGWYTFRKEWLVKSGHIHGGIIENGVWNCCGEVPDDRHP